MASTEASFLKKYRYCLLDSREKRNLDALRRWWDALMQIGPNYGYYQQPAKSWLIVKENKLEEAVRVFGGTNIQITTEGKRHLGAVVGTDENKKKYINDKFSEWKKETNMLTDIVTIHSQAAYTAYVTSYQDNLTFLLRTIPNIKDQFKRIDEVVRHKLILAIIGDHIINDAERVMLSLRTRLGSLGLKIIAEVAENKYKDSTRITSNLQDQILGTNNNEGKSKGEIKAEREKRKITTVPGNVR